MYTSILLVVLFGLLMGLIGFIGLKLTKKWSNRLDKKQQEAKFLIEALGEKTYMELKNNFDAKRIMGEMNYLIDEINEYREQNEFFRSAHKISQDNPNWLRTIKKLYLIDSPEIDEKTKEEIIKFETTKKTLDDYIKKEWNPRVKILSENSISYFSDKVLRDDYNQFINLDKEIQKLTIEGEKIEEFHKLVKVAGIGLVAVTGLAIGAVGAANRAADRQSFRDHFGI